MVEYPKLDYPEGATLVDVRYCNKPEQFEVIFLNPILGKLDVKYEEALIDIWCLKKECRTNKFQIAQTKTEPKISKITLIVPLIILFILAVSVKSLLNLVIIFPLGVIS